ncbi:MULTISPECIES: hypothetical protein [unclassified Psychrobacter]|uniref:hypothetical protein n=1 Tax=unclassified Psychrobacter TaxID=196806 RepID=UPI000B7E3649|nr:MULTISPECIES: hypothetical protein [unclassified Psychrobacter]MDE4455250.1 hypothetical protein [Psychrobacter sp. DAB_AL62B]OXL18107.1 hypothetical protein CAN34_12805 [Psychrobacter sp. DAB_AL32B]
MDDDAKKKITLLLEELLNATCSESRQMEINLELNKLSPDPFWSDYIFWSEEYVNEDLSINYEKFFDKISEYPNSQEYKTKSRLLELAERLIIRDFSEISEVDIVNEINELSPNISWTNYLFVDKTCLKNDGSIDKKQFLNKIFKESWNENFR